MRLKSGLIGVLCFFTAMSLSISLHGQGTVFGPKGGGVLGLQSWNGFERDPLLAWHGAIYLENFQEDAKGTVFAELGYHVRGSSENVFFFTGGGTGFRSREDFRFNNLALLLGAKRYLNTSSAPTPYFSFGVRMDYTLSTNLQKYETYAGYFPIEAFVNKFNYGGSVSFGYVFPFSELVGGFIEASFHPDFSRQYEQPGGTSIISPLTGRSFVLREQQIRNLTFEISIGLRLIHKVIYLD